MILKSKRYLSAFNEYCEVNVEGAYINMKLMIGYRESGTGNWFLVPYITKRLEHFKTVKSETRNREPGTSFLFWFIILMFQKSKSDIRNQFLFNNNWVDTIFWFCLFHQHVRLLMMLKIQRYLPAYNEYLGVNGEAANIKMKLIIGNRISGTWNREPGTVPCSLFE